MFSRRISVCFYTSQASCPLHVSIAADSSPNPIKCSLNLIYICLGKRQYYKRHPYKLYGCVEPSSYAHQQPPQDKYKRRKYHYEENTHECQADDFTLHY
uniref:Uncharacterized protein n=1 Tax=Glossina pallidipes TaxID=7398 RepID=A0A1B0A0P9_GLOPL